MNELPTTRVIAGRVHAMRKLSVRGAPLEGERLADRIGKRGVQFERGLVLRFDRCLPFFVSDSIGAVPLQSG